MNLPLFSWITLFLVLAKTATQLWLERINDQHVRANADKIPEVFKGVIDEATYKKSVAYTLAKSRLEILELIYGMTVFLVVLFSGFLPWFYATVTNHFG